MQNVINDMWKNIGTMKTFDFTKNLDLFKDMNTSKISLQVLDFQKSAFNNTYNTLLKIQEQSEKIADSLIKDNTTIPDEGHRTLDELRLFCKKGQDEIKKTIDDGFVKVESFFSDASKSPKSK